MIEVHTVQILDSQGRVVMRKPLDKTLHVEAGDTLKVKMLMESYIEFKPEPEPSPVGVCGNCNQPIIEYLCADCRSD